MTDQTEKTITLTVRLPESLSRTLGHLAVDAGKSKNRLIVEAVTSALERAVHGRGER